MDVEHCVIAVTIRICEIQQPQIKRRYNVFFDMSVVCWNASETAAGQRVAAVLTCHGLGRTTLQRYRTICIAAKKIYCCGRDAVFHVVEDIWDKKKQPYSIEMKYGCGIVSIYDCQALPKMS